MAVNNVMIFIDDHVIFDLQWYTAERGSSPLVAGLSTVITTAIDGQVGTKITSKLVKNAASQAVTSQEVSAKATHKFFGINELMAQIGRFVTRTIEEEASQVGNVNKTERKVHKVSLRPLSSEPSDSECFSQNWNVTTRRTNKMNKRRKKSTFRSGWKWNS